MRLWGNDQQQLIKVIIVKKYDLKVYTSYYFLNINDNIAGIKLLLNLFIHF